MLSLYTDAGTRGVDTFAATLILEGVDTFLSFFCKRYKNLNGATAGEILAIKQGLEWVRQKRPDVREVAIYTDSLTTAEKLNLYMGKRPLNDIGAYPALWLHVYCLCECFEHVYVYHIKAHQPVLNPNIACDRLCSALLRQCKEGALCLQ